MTRSAPPTVAVVYTSFGVISDLTALFRELGPELRLRHIVESVSLSLRKEKLLNLMNFLYQQLKR